MNYGQRITQNRGVTMGNYRKKIMVAKIWQQITAKE
jgi:hypothetical protein